MRVTATKRHDARRVVVIDCFPESVPKYVEGHAVVAVDVIRATTTAVTAVALGRRCFPAASIEAAAELAGTLPAPLLVGELGGNMPYGFDLNNSPAALTQRNDTSRPMILLSTAGTPTICAAASASAAYVACLRNVSAQVAELRARHSRVALVAAGARGEFREEDELCCAWIAASLLAVGFEAEDDATMEHVERWREASLDAVTRGKSAEYLRRSGQDEDLDFILAHVDDLDAVFPVHDGEVRLAPAAARPTPSRRPASSAAS